MNKHEILTLPPTKLNDGEHSIRIIAANKNGNHAFPFHQKITVNKKTEDR